MTRKIIQEGKSELSVIAELLFANMVVGEM